MKDSILFVMIYTLIRKEVVRILRIWPQSIFPSCITMTLYFLIFGEILGNKIGLMDGVNYVEFITPGLIIMAVVNNAYTNVVSSFYGARFNLSIQELLVSPIGNHTIIIGFVSGGMFRSLIVGILVCLIAGVFGGLDISHPLLFCGVMISCSFLFSLGGLLNGIFSQSFDDITIFPTFILTPLVYLGGTFYSLTLLSNPWYTIASFNPLFYIVDLFRFSSLGFSEFNPLFSFSVIIIFCVILYSIVIYCLNNGIRLKT